MTYTLIGTGNMAWFLTRKFYEQGYKCTGVYGRNIEAANELAQSIRTNTINEVAKLPESDCCIIAISDRGINEISNKLLLKNAVVIHTAGAVSLDAITQSDKAVLWPVYSINKNNLPYHRNIPVICEYNSKKAQQIVMKLANVLSDILQEANWQQRQWLHLCAVIGNNFTNHLMAVCEKICAEQQLSFSLLQPILQQTFERLQTVSPMASQTGPAIRNDTVTIEKHLQLLKQHPHWQKVYESLSTSIEDMYKISRD